MCEGELFLARDTKAVESARLTADAAALWALTEYQQQPKACS